MAVPHKKDTDESAGAAPLDRLLLSEKEAAAIIGFTPRFLQARRHRGGGPAFIRISQRAVRYTRHDLEKWIDERRRASTSEI